MIQHILFLCAKVSQFWHFYGSCIGICQAFYLNILNINVVDNAYFLDSFIGLLEFFLKRWFFIRHCPCNRQAVWLQYKKVTCKDIYYPCCEHPVGTSRFRFVKKPVLGSEIHGKCGSASLNGVWRRCPLRRIQELLVGELMKVRHRRNIFFDPHIVVREF